MATIVVRTNPDRRPDGRWACSQCHEVYRAWDKAKRCAERDYKKRTGRRSIKPRSV